ncbi:MAG: hypothetical protein AAGJ08_27505 [Cyanobacteria bacterium P01_H01_bin.35]
MKNLLNHLTIILSISAPQNFALTQKNILSYNKKSTHVGWVEERHPTDLTKL